VTDVTQQIIVGLLVFLAVLVSIWKLMPARRRLRALLALDAWLVHRDFLQGWRERVLGKRIRAAGGSGCAGCAANVGLRTNRPSR
jgi:hypothetical protein